MKYEKVKKESDLPIGEKLVSAELTTVDGSEKSIELRFENGAVVRASVENYSTFTVAITAKPKKVERFKVSGKLLGIDLTQVFSDKSVASRYETKLRETKGVIEIERESVMIPEESPVLDDLPSDDESVF